MEPSENSAPNSIKRYITGFGLSVVLTLTAFFVVMNQLASGSALLLIILLLAIVQFFVQLRYFLHLGTGAGWRWNAIVFGFMLMVLLIIVLGSLWIMSNLDYHMLHNQEYIDEWIIKDEGY